MWEQPDRNVPGLLEIERDRVLAAEMKGRDGWTVLYLKRTGKLVELVEHHPVQVEKGDLMEKRELTKEFYLKRKVGMEEGHVYAVRENG